MAADTMVMLDLLQEAGEEPVTLDELGVAGVRDPARALLELELAGLEIQRVLVKAERAGAAHECIRLAQQPAAASAPPEQPTVELAAVAPRPSPAPRQEPVSASSPRPTPASLRGLFALGVLLALLALALRRS
jgi:hypothetical protein